LIILILSYGKEAEHLFNVTPADLKLILADSELEDDVLTAFINSASTMVSNVLQGYLDSNTLAEITKWLAAHMISCTVERMASREGAGGAEIYYTGRYGQELSATPYGQMVLVLDPTGRMSSLGGKAVSMIAIRSF
jgi:hypothetical protein